MKNVITQIKRHERNSGDELTQEGRERAFNAGKDFGSFLCDMYTLVQGVSFYHSPLKRANQTVNLMYEGMLQVMPDAIDAVSIRTPEEVKLLETQNFTDEYRKNILGPVASRDVWLANGLKTLLTNNPGTNGCEYNEEAAARVAKHVLSNNDYFKIMGSRSQQIISVTHGPLPEWFLVECQGGKRNRSIDDVISWIKGPFDNGDVVQVIASEKKSGILYTMDRGGFTIAEIGIDKMRQIADYKR